MVYPPSTANACPITKLAPGLQSQTTASATSSARPSRPIGTSLIISFIASAWLVSMPATIGVDDSGADCVDADAPGGVFEGCAFGESKHAVLAGVICRPPGYAYESTERGIIDDCPTPLFAHLEQLVLHAAKHRPEIDGVHAVEFRHAGIGDFCHGALNTGVVERRIQPPEGRNRLPYHGFYLRVISHVALYADGFVTAGDQLFGGRASRSFIDVRQRHRCTFRGKCPRSGQAHAGAGPCDERDFVLKRQIHGFLSQSARLIPEGRFAWFTDMSVVPDLRGTERLAPGSLMWRCQSRGGHPE